jgi:hypothetical protein
VPASSVRDGFGQRAAANRPVGRPTPTDGLHGCASAMMIDADRAVTLPIDWRKT